VLAFGAYGSRESLRRKDHRSEDDTCFVEFREPGANHRFSPVQIYPAAMRRFVFPEIKPFIQFPRVLHRAAITVPCAGRALCARDRVEHVPAKHAMSGRINPGG
jgi:hypothetical protein